MALGKKKKHAKQFVTPKLQITAMMDMFTIVLIFLLFSFSDKPETVNIDKELDLPQSTAKMDYNETIKMVLSHENLKLNDTVVAQLENGKITGLKPDRLKDSDLFRKLSFYREEMDRAMENEKKGNHILFFCDKRIPFKTISSIMKTAGMAGFPDFQFAVLRKEGAMK